MLQVSQVSKSYDGRAVVDQLSFQVEAGELFALLGPNGAGKTTLIRMITDILRPDSGTIRLDGREIDPARRHEIAYLPEERGLYRRSKTIDVLTYFGQLKGLSAKAAHRAGLDLLARVELADWADKQVQALSKGMQQKAQLCTALIGEPRLLILDEPFSGLDPINTQLFEEILRERRASGCTVLLSTHQMNKVEKLCDRALIIHRGYMVLYGAVREFRRRYADHAVIVRGDGIPESLPGVTSIAHAGGEATITLEPAAAPNAVLSALLERGATIESFQRATLPLEDVFIKVVREGLGLDHGVSASEPGTSAAEARA
jgi:ABC-2 type transport system ATP-binding protein